MEVKEYLEEGNHLPEFIKNFHDQKDLFKAIYQQWKGKNEILDKINWVNAHVFIIDVFLWWMGLHGYKLQKTRKKDIEFYDPESTIKHYNKERNKNAFTFLTPNKCTHKWERTSQLTDKKRCAKCKTYSS